MKVAAHFHSFAFVLRFTATLVVGLAALSCDHQPPTGSASRRPALTVTDMAGRTVVIQQPVERIVLIRGRDIYELAMLLGDETEKKLVAFGPDLESADQDAWTKFSARFPTLEKLPRVGSIFDDAVSAEQVLALKPDLVVVDVIMAKRKYKSIDRMVQAGLPLLFLQFSDDPFRDPLRSVTLLGRVLGKEQRAAEVVGFANAELDKVYSRLPARTADSPSIYIESGSKGAGEYGPTYGEPGGSSVAWGTVMRQLPCRNIAAAVAPELGPIHPEQLLQTNPDVIVITGANWQQPGTMRMGYSVQEPEARERLRAFTARPGWPELRAVRTGRVYGMFHGFCMHSFDFAALQQLAKWLYPEQFAELNPESALRTFHERFLPIEYGGTWMIKMEEAQ